MSAGQPPVEPGVERPAEEAAPPEGLVRVNLPVHKPVVTYTLLGLTVVVFLLQTASQYLLGNDLPLLVGAKINAYIRAGELWRLITPVLLHGSILHIGFNMYALYILGPGLERPFGPARFLALYLLGGFAGNVLSFIFSPAVSVGSSTAIFGLLGAQGVFVYQNRRLFGGRTRTILFNTITIAAVNLVIGLSPGIDNWGHLGGLIGGTMFAWLAGPRFELEGLYPRYNLVDRREKPQVVLAAVGVAGLFAALFFLVLSRGI